MKQKSEGIGLVVGRVQRIEEEAANASLKVILLLLFFVIVIVIVLLFLWLLLLLFIKFLLHRQQELLLGEQTPSPSLSRSSSVSSVLMVSNVTFVIIIDYFHIYLLTKYYPISIVIDIFIFLVGSANICLIFFTFSSVLKSSKNCNWTKASATQFL